MPGFGVVRWGRQVSERAIIGKGVDGCDRLQQAEIGKGGVRLGRGWGGRGGERTQCWVWWEQHYCVAVWPPLYQPFPVLSVAQCSVPPPSYQFSVNIAETSP